VKLPAAPSLRAMVLLGLNAGFGNTDCARLPLSAVNLNTGWIRFPRPKTEVPRRVPLWPETVAALQAAIAARPKPVDSADRDLVFLTERGTPFVRMQPSKTREHQFVCINSLSRRFELLLKRLKIEGRAGIGFYTLRHVFATAAGECKDQVAVDFVMGHCDESMADRYREGISDTRLQAVVNTVRNWLFNAAMGDIAESAPSTTPQPFRIVG
jgi:integrase